MRVKRKIFLALSLAAISSTLIIYSNNYMSNAQVNNKPDIRKKVSDFANVSLEKVKTLGQEQKGYKDAKIKNYLMANLTMLLMRMVISCICIIRLLRTTIM